MGNDKIACIIGKDELGKLGIWDTSRGKWLLHPAEYPGPRAVGAAIAASPDGDRIAVITAHAHSRPRVVVLDRLGRLLDAPVRAPVKISLSDGDDAVRLAFSHDARQLACSASGTIWIFTPRERKEPVCVELSDYGISADAVDELCFSPDGKRLVTTADHHTQIWDSATLRLLESNLGRIEVAALAAGESHPAQRNARRRRPGRADGSDIGAGKPLYEYRACADDRETTIKDTVSGRPVAFYPERLERVASYQPSHQQFRWWSGLSDRHPVSFCLERTPFWTSPCERQSASELVLRRRRWFTGIVAVGLATMIAAAGFNLVGFGVRFFYFFLWGWFWFQTERLGGVRQGASQPAPDMILRGRWLFFGVCAVALATTIAEVGFKHVIGVPFEWSKLLFLFGVAVLWHVKPGLYGLGMVQVCAPVCACLAAWRVGTIVRVLGTGAAVPAPRLVPVLLVTSWVAFEAVAYLGTALLVCQSSSLRAFAANRRATASITPPERERVA